VPVILKQAIAIVLTVAVSGALALPVAAAAASQAAKVASETVVIRSPAELALYLKAAPHDESPLWLLPSGARKRFLETLVWGSKGLGGFATGDLEQYLTDAQIRRVLALFDVESYADGLQGRAKPLTAAERKAPETVLERKFDEVYFARTDTAHGKSHTPSRVLYDHLLAPYQHPRKLDGLDDSDLGLLFRAAGTAASMSHDARYLDDQRIDLAELHRRGIATSGQIVDVHGASIAARRFTDANALASTFPSAGIKSLPPLRQAPNLHDGSPTALIVVPDGKSLLRSAVDMHAPLRIVVVAGCHFSVDAVRAIRADPQLDALFREHAVWLADENESLGDVLTWNREFPDQRMYVAWRNDEWPMLTSWNIPTFYVFRDGKKVDQWSGWGTRGMGNLLSHLREDGVID
jgi:hypothetical protein